MKQLCKIKVIKKTGPVGRVNSFHGIPSAPGSEASSNPEGSQDTSSTQKNVHSHDFEGVMDKIEILSQALRR